MLWRARTTLPDRPGTLADLARTCGEAEVNILGLQIFPGVGAVTDELVLRTPVGWSAQRVVDLVVGAGGTRVHVSACTEAALVDQPTRYVQAARAVLSDPMSYPEVVGRLLDADAESASSADGPDVPAEPDVMEVSVGELVMQVRRVAAFTATEHARGAALADLVSDVLGRVGLVGGPGSAVQGSGGRRLGEGVVPEHVVDGSSVAAVVDGVVVGLATVLPADALPAGEDGPVAHPVTVRVDPAWRRRGVGTRLLSDVGRLARALGAQEVVLVTSSANPAVLPMVMATGLRGRIRLHGDELTVRVPVGSLAPLGG